MSECGHILGRVAADVCYIWGRAVILVAQVNITGYWDLYNQVLSDSTSLARAGAMPSSGLLGEPLTPLQDLLHPPDLGIHEPVAFLGHICFMEFPIRQKHGGVLRVQCAMP